MCSTCGCSGHETEVRLTDLGEAPETSLEVAQAARAHFHSHADGSVGADSSTDIQHAHNSDAGGAAHHGHAHGHEHPHTHPVGARTLHLEQEILAKNNLLAERNRGWFEGRRIAAINLMSSPGAGKTTLLERTIHDLREQVPIFVVEGDQETTRDSERIKRVGGRAIQINTGNGCHLDAAMLAAAARKLDPAPHSLVMIENVGNLVCPALFDLGECARVAMMSVTEGEDKPLKYPNMFRAAGVMVLNKIDLLPHVRFDVAECVANARAINPAIELFELSASRGDGLHHWYAWLREQIAAYAANDSR